MVERDELKIRWETHVSSNLTSTKKIKFYIFYIKFEFKNLLQIEYWSDPNNQIDKTVEIVQLYYDENNNESEVDVNINIIKIEN